MQFSPAIRTLCSHKGDGWLMVGGVVTAQLAVNFNSGNPLDWEVGLVESAQGGVKAFGCELQGSIVASTAINCQSLQQLKGKSASLDIEANYLMGGTGVSVSNIHPLICPNVTGDQPTVFNIATGIGPAPISPVEPVAGGGSYGPTWVQSTTIREPLQKVWNFYFGNLAPWK